MSPLLAAALAIALLLPPTAPAPAGGEGRGSGGEATYVCVMASERELRGAGLTPDEVYASFVTVELSGGERALLRSSGLAFFEVTGRDEVALPGASFTLGAAELRGKGLGRLELSGEGPFYLIIKMKGPVKSGWVSGLRAAGAEVLGLLSHFNVIARVGRAELGAVASLPFVRWLGELRPEHKLLHPLPEGDPVRFEVAFFREAAGDFALCLDMVRGSGGRVVELDSETAWWSSALVEAPRAAALSILRLPGLWALEPWDEPKPRNDVARWVVQSFDNETRPTPYWDAGLNGRGIIIGLADSGVDYDHVCFRNGTSEQGTPGPAHRKLVRYNTSVDDWDQLGHGTHVAGTLAGDSIETPGMYDPNDGVAFGARIAFYDIVDANGSWQPPLIRGILGDAYASGATSHSDSWGDDRKEYSLRAQRIDQFLWDHPDFLVFVAAGNSGPEPGSVLEPATAKNIVAVGAAVNGNTTDVASFSAHGPTPEGLIAPTLVAPGQSLMSASSDSTPYSYNSGYRTMHGTSMATPVAAGAGAIVEQYFREGFYPGGARGSSAGFMPSGALRKAVLVLSCWDQLGGRFVDGPAPDFSQGWGKLKLLDALYLAGDDRTPRLWVEDLYNDSRASDGLATGETRTHHITANSSRPLRVALVWSDWPGAGLVNDLNLEVTAPDGRVYRGNQLLNGSSAPSEAADATNTVEAVFLPTPIPGHYVINVTAVSVGSGGRQRYALAATGGLLDPSIGELALSMDRAPPESLLSIHLSDSDLRGRGSATVRAWSQTEPLPEEILLSETGASGSFEGELRLLSGSPGRDGALEVSDGDRVRVEYRDESPRGVVWAEAVIDGSPPRPTRVAIENLTNASAFVRVETDEVSYVTALYRSASSSLMESGAGLAFAHALALGGLRPATDYLLDLELEDSCGNSALWDFGGSSLAFRTHDLTYAPGVGMAGWAKQGEETGRFGEGVMRVGIEDGAQMLGALRFDTPGFPEGVVVTGAWLRLMPGDTDPALSGSLFTVEMLPADSLGLFDGALRPNWTELREAVAEGMVGWSFGPAELRPGEWLCLSISEPMLRVLYRSALAGGVGFRVRGPSSGSSSHIALSTGATEDLEWARPQLVLDLDRPPRVRPFAPRSLSMSEDLPDSTSLNLLRVFEDEGPMNFSSPTHCEGSGAFVTARVSPDGSVTLTPLANWSGEDIVDFRATDALGLTADHTIAVSVRPINDPPVIVSVDGRAAESGMVLEARQDEAFTATLRAEDPDIALEGDELYYHTNDTLVRFRSLHSNVIAFTPGNDDVGRRSVRIIVRDGRAEASLDAVFDILNVNDPPFAHIGSPAPGGVFDNATPVFFSASGTTDPDLMWGDTLTYTWESNLMGVIGHGEELEATLPPGHHIVTLTVIDLRGAYGQDSVELFVKAIEPPPPPPPPPQETHPTAGSDMRWAVGGLVALALALSALGAAWRLRRPGSPSRGREKPESAEVEVVEEE
ncbi:MAG: S8 family serine peptidase [Thermoplasmatota archaeon]